MRKLSAMGKEERGMVKGQGERFRSNGARGQSTLEYILVLVAILAGILLVANASMKTAVDDTMGKAGTKIGDATAAIKGKLGLK